MSFRKLTFLSFVTCIFFSPTVNAQAPDATPTGKYYLASAGETIFSLGIVESKSSDLSPVVRFSPVFNIQEQMHFDFNDHFGIYTGIGVRNVGLISHVTDLSGNTEKIKERSYSLGVPLAFKFGDLKSGSNLALGVEAELMFAYKRKIIQGDHKNRYTAWLSDNVNNFNPSFYAELKFQKGQYIRVKYYLRDFLNYRGITLINGETVPDYGPKSPLFYVAIGTVTLKQKLNNPTPQPDIHNAFFKSQRRENTTSSLTAAGN